MDFSLIKTQNADKVCYLILPEGVSKDLNDDLQELAELFSLSFVMVEGADWNDDLTPWPALGVFKKAKSFGGRASAFLTKLCNEIVPKAEVELGLTNPQRTLMGVSLSGLFAVWTAFNTDVFQNVISISGSLWYDGFAEWVRTHEISPKVEGICLLLGEKEKNAKEKRMATVEEKTTEIAAILKGKCQGKVVFELVEGTHFSPVVPRMVKALSAVLGK
ncbi:MAG: hypothetical protein MJZ91_08695 [Bacteroidales bacterium]|nr:hypothetical protein [Bacteroidales bacterium]